MLLNNKNKISTFIVATFSFLMLATAFISEFFQAPIISSENFSEFQILFKKEDLSTVSVIKLKSNLGEFILENDKEKNWKLLFPRKINADLAVVSTILKSLENIRIKKIYPKDTINLGNFSLDNPIYTIELSNGNFFKKKISFGLINPIDNSTYITLAGEGAIYHINTLDKSLERLEITGLIDSRIFNLEYDEISSIKIFPRFSSFPSLNLSKVKNNWFNKRKKLNKIEVEKFLKKLTRIKSHTILDQQTEKLKNKVQYYMKRYLFQGEIENIKKEKIKYKVSYVINSLPDLPMGRKQLFILETSNRTYPFLVSKDYLTLFYRKSFGFR